jgi:hypothetical protein
MAKVRRSESFSFTWKDDISTGGGRTSVYIHPGVSMVFKYYGCRTPQLNPAWLQALTYHANSSRGLYIAPEPEGNARPPAPPQELVFGEVPLSAPFPPSS